MYHTPSTMSTQEHSDRTADEPPIALAVNHESRTEAESVFEKIRLVNVFRIPNDRYESLGSAAYGGGDEFQGIDAGYHFFNAGNDMVILPLDLIYRPFRYGKAEYYLEAVHLEHPLRNCLGNVRVLAIVQENQNENQRRRERITDDDDRMPRFSSGPLGSNFLSLFSGLKELRLVSQHHSPRDKLWHNELTWEGMDWRAEEIMRYFEEKNKANP
ncbi:hypothetical protein B0J14DRAFT_664700 [Halenospora varia]|nr:hypothetical protein B0J14DRAFT_664700 [Halenospora varia]